MSKPISFGKLDLTVVGSMDELRGVPQSETPFRVLIFGDFSGRVNRGLLDAGTALAGWRPLAVDRDNIDELMGKLGVEVRLPLAGEGGPLVTIRFKELEDFHPDRIFQRVELFQTLRETRRKLDDPAAFASMSSRVRIWAGSEAGVAPEREAAAPEMPPIAAGGLLDHVVEKTEGRPAETGRAAGASDWDTFLDRIVRPYVVPSPDPQVGEVKAAIDAAATGLMSAILHHPDFQAIEAAWRGVHFVVSRTETDTALRPCLVDISKAELAADLMATEDLRSSATYGLLVEQTIGTPGGEPWAVLAGDYTFDETAEDAALLGRMARIASEAGAPFISGAHPHVAGAESLVEKTNPDEWHWLAGPEDRQAWEALRRLLEASYLGLALPRFLLRLPYGADTEPTEQFEFEEMDAVPEHAHYLWGNPCFACVHLLARSFSRYGWNLRPGLVLDVEGLPLHVYKERGESRAKACAEVVLTEDAVDHILDKGLMVLVSFRNQDRVRLARFQSLADPAAGLSGRWRQTNLSRP